MTTLQDRIAAALLVALDQSRLVTYRGKDPDASDAADLAAAIVAALGPEQEARDRVVEAARAWCRAAGRHEGVVRETNAALRAAVAALEALSGAP
jgi:hypothetical protein